MFLSITTYTQYNFSLFDTLIFFWFNMVLITLAIFLVCLFIIISFYLPQPIGTKLSIVFNHVCMGLCTTLRAIIPRALTSICLCSTTFKAPFPSIGTPNASTTRLSKAFPT